VDAYTSMSFYFDVIYVLQIIGSIFYKEIITNKIRIVKKKGGPKNKQPLYPIQ